MVCKMSRFYSTSLHEIINMPIDAFNKAWECMTRIEAQEQLLLMSSSQYPHLDKTSRSKIHKDLYAKAYPEATKKKVNKIDQQTINRLLGVRDV